MIELVYLSLGSNLGQKEEYIHQAIQEIKERAGKVISESALFYSEPWGFSSDNGFVNCCVSLKTPHEPQTLLHILQEIEKDMGRTHKSTNGVYSDRVIDIDIILWGDRTIQTPTLKVPHPLMEVRDFVMIPLKELQTKLKDSRDSDF